MSNKIREQIEKFLSDRSIKFGCDHLGTHTDNDNGKLWEHNAYTARFVREDYKPGYFESPLKSGMTHTSDPCAADLLYSLIMDMPNGDSFKDWCANLGFSDDSIKANKLYDLCLESEKKLKSFFTESELTELQSILQDY